MCTINYAVTCRRHVGSAVQPDWSISESLTRLVLKTGGPINTFRNTRICSPNRRYRAMHDRSSPFSVPSLPDPPVQWLILVFRRCPHHRGSFSQRLLRVQLLDPQLVPPLWDGLSHFMELSQTRLPRHTSLPCCYCIFACSASSLDLPCLLPSRFSSHAPGKHRLVFVVSVRVTVPLYSIYDCI